MGGISKADADFPADFRDPRKVIWAGFERACRGFAIRAWQASSIRGVLTKSCFGAKTELGAFPAALP
ncbi:hypothetical protein A8M32_12435 [Sinorhizobium alkalisoli]|uniref:Uncharacterized protein n=1 Tax=Sinorhizobium alkalisoli TaxID=1752398 RepID=A0A1E3VB87_9HYPH|nr:hypothetical protein A8M32_12435 [Sinorhizobium alkalisoli]QFI67904.1 hypothetical protein EKH55_3030 [Sinorhizobium alkalisoli]